MSMNQPTSVTNPKVAPKMVYAASWKASKTQTSMTKMSNLRHLTFYLVSLFILNHVGIARFKPERFLVVL